MVTAQRTPSATDAKLASSPSPSHFTSRPPCWPMASRRSWRCAYRTRWAQSSPIRWRSAVEPTRSVNNSVTGVAAIAGSHTISDGRGKRRWLVDGDSPGALASTGSGSGPRRMAQLAQKGLDDVVGVGLFSRLESSEAPNELTLTATADLPVAVGAGENGLMPEVL